jgi:thiol-disulfide isomerase/thioredoxin
MPRRRTVEAPASGSRMPLIIGGGVVLLVIFAAVVAMALSASPGSSVDEPSTRPVSVAGAALPDFTDPAGDAAVGQPVPELSGIGLDGEPLTIGPDDGPMAVVVLAHWCAHCQAEVPRLVDYMESGAQPEGVSVVALTTSINPAQPNYPPSAWLEREAWTAPTLIDDGSNSGLAALGLSSFPGFVFVDADGIVAARRTGEIGADAFGQLLEQIAP